MLDRFSRALSKLCVNGKKVSVKIIKRESGEYDENEDLNNKVRSQLDESDFVICYGDTDNGTTSLVRLLQEVFDLDKSKIGAIIEKMNHLYEINDLLSDENIFLIYKMILESFS